jgi:hypothetical protein
VWRKWFFADNHIFKSCSTVSGIRQVDIRLIVFIVPPVVVNNIDVSRYLINGEPGKVLMGAGLIIINPHRRGPVVAEIMRSCKPDIGIIRTFALVSPDQVEATAKVSLAFICH